MYIENSILIIDIGEELDHHKADIIRKKSDSIIDNMGIANVILDFSKTSFMDSSGIGLIMGLKRKLLNCGADVVLSGVQHNIERILGMTKICNTVAVFPDITEAKKILKNR